MSINNFVLVAALLIVGWAVGVIGVFDSPSTVPPPAAVPEPISPAAVEDWSVVA